MPSIENTAVCFIGKDDKRNAASLQTTHYDANERVKRALLKLGLFWLLALGSIPIIFAHWVLVPGFFLAGPWMAWRTYQVTAVRNHVSGVCTNCNTEIQVKLEPGDELPKWTYCPSCNAPLQIVQPD